jgi:hypothetical protein
MLTTAGDVLLDKIQRYVPLMLDKWVAWVDVDMLFPPAVISAWTGMAVAWEADASNPNPFQSTIQYESLCEVKCQLADVAAKDVEQLHVQGDMHKTEMLSMGLQLEEQQYVVFVFMWDIGPH